MPDAISRAPRVRAERMILATRVALAMYALFAIWLDPAEPARYARLTYTLHASYLAYASVIAAVLWRHATLGTLPLITHVADIALFSIFQYLTLGPSSPFFVYFVFSLFCGALRWGWRGAIGTAPVVLIAFIAIGLSMRSTLGPVEFELNRFVIRIGYLVMVATLLGYLGLHERRLREEIEHLARWPPAVGVDRSQLTERVLTHACAVVGAGTALVVWEQIDEPRVSVASWSVNGFSVTRHATMEFDPVVPGALDDASFATVGSIAGATVLVSRSGRLSEWRGTPVHADLLPRLGSGDVASAPFHTERLAGRAFFGELGGASAEVLPLVEVVAREIGSSLDQMEMHARQQQLAIGEERIRVARDLHDGVLQSLTGVRLELQSVATSLDASALDQIRDRLLAIERALAIEQRELRLFIDDLKPFTAPKRTAGELAIKLAVLRERIGLEWKVPITLRVGAPLASLAADVEEAIPLMVHEGIVNALKHGHPSRVAVDVESAADGIRITISDDGRGFPFRGRYDHARLAASNVGPVSLRERVASLGGQMAIESGETGARVEILLQPPLREA